MAIKLEDDGTQKKITLTGVLDEGFNPAADLGAQLKGLSGDCIVDCAAVNRINSTGIKQWILFFNMLREKHVNFKFARVSPVIVEQLNLISNFSCGGSVLSVCLPFTCKDCGASITFVQEKKNLANVNLDKPGWACTKCGKKNLEFDDIGDDYLRFWK